MTVNNRIENEIISCFCAGGTALGGLIGGCVSGGLAATGGAVGGGYIGLGIGKTIAWIFGYANPALRNGVETIEEVKKLSQNVNKIADEFNQGVIELKRCGRYTNNLIAAAVGATISTLGGLSFIGISWLNFPGTMESGAQIELKFKYTAIAIIAIGFIVIGGSGVNTLWNIRRS